MELAEAYKVLGKLANGIESYNADTMLTNNLTAGWVYIALVSILANKAS